MQQCLICQAGEDTSSLLRVPVSVEGSPLGDFVVCSGCFELLGQEKVAALIRAAALAGVQKAAGLSGDEATTASQGPQDTAAEGFEAVRTLDATLPASALADEAAFSAWLGRQLAPLFLSQYRQGRGQVTLLTSLTQGESDYRFRAVLGD